MASLRLEIVEKRIELSGVDPWLVTGGVGLNRERRSVYAGLHAEASAKPVVDDVFKGALSRLRLLADPLGNIAIDGQGHSHEITMHLGAAM